VTGVGVTRFCKTSFNSAGFLQLIEQQATARSARRSDPTMSNSANPNTPLWFWEIGHCHPWVERVKSGKKSMSKRKTQTHRHGGVEWEFEASLGHQEGRRSKSMSKSNGMSGERKLNCNARWLQFTETEQARIREVYERDGAQAASAHCSKIGKPWSRSAIGEFFRRERDKGLLEGLRDIRKLRSDAGWQNFTAVERAKIWRIYEKEGQRRASAYCHKIGKDWSAAGIGGFFPASARGDCSGAEEDTRGRGALDGAAPGLCRGGDGDRGSDGIRSGGEAAGSGQIVQRRPKDAERSGGHRAPGAAPDRAAVAGVEGKATGGTERGAELGLGETSFSAVEAVQKNYDNVAEIMAGSGSSDEKTEALGRLIFGDEWDVGKAGGATEG
jgi:hypothetical protein